MLSTYRYGRYRIPGSAGLCFPMFFRTLVCLNLGARCAMISGHTQLVTSPIRYCTHIWSHACNRKMNVYHEHSCTRSCKMFNRPNKCVRYGTVVHARYFSLDTNRSGAGWEDSFQFPKMFPKYVEAVYLKELYTLAN